MLLHVRNNIISTLSECEKLTEKLTNEKSADLYAILVSEMQLLHSNWRKKYKALNLRKASRFAQAISVVLKSAVCYTIVDF